MSAVSGAEGVIDIGVRELGQRPGQLRVIGGLTGLKAQVLEQQDLAVPPRVKSRTSSPTTAGASITDASVSCCSRSATGRSERAGSEP
jgi:hypothetical protein